jgi:ribosomal protein L21E
MFEWLLGKKTNDVTPYVNPFKVGDRVELIWNLYNDGGAFQRLMDEDDENEHQRGNEGWSPTWDIFQIILERGKTGNVSGIIRDSVIVEIDGFPFKIVVREEGLRKLD